MGKSTFAATTRALSLLSSPSSVWAHHLQYVFNSYAAISLFPFTFEGIKESDQSFLQPDRLLESLHTRPSVRRKLHHYLPTNTQWSTMSTMRSLSVPVELVCEQHSVLPRLVSTLRVYPSSSQLGVTQWLHREESMLRWVICTRM